MKGLISPLWPSPNLRIAASQLTPMPVIVGSPRSGTTLLRSMVDAHPEIAIPPETGFAVAVTQLPSDEGLRLRFFETLTQFPPDAPSWGDFEIDAETFWQQLTRISPFSVTEGLRCFYRCYADRFGKQRWGDKTPMYCCHLQTIEQVLPEAHFVHIIRDGRDAALSLRNLWFSPGRDMETLARHWVRDVATAREQGRKCRKYMEVRYEDLVSGSRQVVMDVCNFVELLYHPAMEKYYERTPDRLREHKARVRPDGSVVVSQEQRHQQQQLTLQPPDSSRAFNWRTSMTSEDRSAFEEVAAPLLQELGYS